MVCILLTNRSISRFQCYRSVTKVEGGGTKTLGLWSGCETSGDHSVCDILNECNVFVSSGCAKRQAARAFMVISLIFSTVGCIYLLAVIIAHFKCPSPSNLTIVAIGITHFLSFLSGIFGFPLGLSFALYDKNSSVGLSGVLAIVAIFVNMFSTCISCYGTAKLEDDDATVNPSANDVEATNPSTEQSISTVQYYTKEDSVNAF